MPLPSSQINLDMIIKKANVKKGMTVADYGCGSGFFTRKVATIVTSTGIVYAVDVMKEVLLNLQKLANLSGIQNIKTIWSDLERFGATNISNSVVDVGFIINTLFQTNKEKEFLTEVSRMIKIGGHVIVVDWTDEAVSTIAPSSVDRTGLDKVRKVARLVGNLKEVDVFAPGSHHYGIIFEKINN